VAVDGSNLASPATSYAFSNVVATHTISATCSCPNNYPECNGVLTWNSTKSYAKANTAIYNIRLYKAAYASINSIPDTYEDWTLMSYCGPTPCGDIWRNNAMYVKPNITSLNGIRYIA